jgi:hypothetical protein
VELGAQLPWRMPQLLDKAYHFKLDEKTPFASCDVQAQALVFQQLALRPKFAFAVILSALTWLGL